MRLHELGKGYGICVKRVRGGLEACGTEAHTLNVGAQYRSARALLAVMLSCMSYPLICVAFVSFSSRTAATPPLSTAQSV